MQLNTSFQNAFKCCSHAYRKSVRAETAHGLHMLDGITVIRKRPLNCMHACTLYVSTCIQLESLLWVVLGIMKHSTRKLREQEGWSGTETHWNDISPSNLVWFQASKLLPSCNVDHAHSYNSIRDWQLPCI